MCNLESLQDELTKKFTPKKKQAKKLACVYKRIGYEKRSKLVGSCATYVDYDVHADQSVTLSRVYFCKDMLCPLCVWRKELKLFGQVSKIIDVLQEQKYRFVFVTLTVRNCPATSEALKEVINDFNAAYTKLTRLQRISRIVKGAFRSIEVTYNEEKDEFHPHIHLIWVVPKDYFTSTDYLKQSELCYLWKQSLNIDYTPICDIRVVSGKKVTQKGKIISYDLKSAVAEVCKYAVKSTDYLNHDDDVNDKIVSALVDALAHRRLVMFYGVFAEVRRKLDMDGDLDDDLVHVSDKKNDSDVLYTMSFRWDNKTGKYIQYYVRVHVDINIQYDDDTNLLTG